MQKRFFVEQVVPDPVRSAFDLPLQRTFYPLGFPLELETNSDDVLEAAFEGWGAFTQAYAEAPVRLCLGTTESESAHLPLQSVIRSRGHLMSIVANRENFAVCDFEQGFAFGWATRGVAADHPLLRYRFLVPAGATLIEQRWLAPLHGALVVRNGKGVMLCGDANAGKSTLAYACARAGWAFVSDDGTFMVRSRSDRYAIGDPHSIRFRDDAPSLFPELSDRLPVIRPNGKVTIEVFTRDLPIATAPGCVIDHSVFLSRSASGPAGLEPYSTQRALDNWSYYGSLGADAVRTEQRRCHERLLGAGLWELRYSRLEDAIARLEQLVDGGA